MKHVIHTLVGLLKEDSGQDLIEYALVAAVIGVGAVVTLRSLSNHIVTAFTSVGTSLTNSV